MAKILTHLGPDPEPPPRSLARETGYDVAASEMQAGTGCDRCTVARPADSTAIPVDELSLVAYFWRQPTRPEDAAFCRATPKAFEILLLGFPLV